MPRVTGTLSQVAVGLPIVNAADVAGDATASARGLATAAQIAKLDGIDAGAEVNLEVGTTAGTVAAGNDSRIIEGVRAYNTFALARATGANHPNRLIINGKGSFAWDPASTATDDGTENATAIAFADTPTGRALPSAGSTIAVLRVDDSEVSVSKVAFVPGHTVTSGVLSTMLGDESASAVALSTDASTAVLAQTLSGLGASKKYVARFGFRVSIWKDATKTDCGSMDCELDAHVSTDGSSVATVTFSTTPYFDPSLLKSGIAGVSAAVVESTGGFTISATRVAGIACSAVAAWWCVTMRDIT